MTHAPSVLLADCVSSWRSAIPNLLDQIGWDLIIHILKQMRDLGLELLLSLLESSQDVSS